MKITKQYVVSQYLQLQHTGYRLEKLQFRPEILNSWNRSFIKEQQKAKKIWQETRDAACKMAINWVTQHIRMVRRGTFER